MWDERNKKCWFKMRNINDVGGVGGVGNFEPMEVDLTQGGQYCTKKEELGTIVASAEAGPWTWGVVTGNRDHEKGWRAEWLNKKKNCAYDEWRSHLHQRRLKGTNGIQDNVADPVFSTAIFDSRPKPSLRTSESSWIWGLVWLIKAKGEPFSESGKCI